MKVEDVEKVMEEFQENQEENKERDDLFMQMGNRDDDDDEELLKELEAETALDELGNLPSVPKNAIEKQVPVKNVVKIEDEDEKELKKMMNAA